MTNFCKDCVFYVPMGMWDSEIHEKSQCSNPEYQEHPIISPVTGENLTPNPRCYLVRADGLKCDGFVSRTTTSFNQDQILGCLSRQYSNTVYESNTVNTSYVVMDSDPLPFPETPIEVVRPVKTTWWPWS